MTDRPSAVAELRAGDTVIVVFPPETKPEQSRMAYRRGGDRPCVGDLRVTRHSCS